MAEEQWSSGAAEQQGQADEDSKQKRLSGCFAFFSLLQALASLKEGRQRISMIKPDTFAYCSSSSLDVGRPGNAISFKKEIALRRELPFPHSGRAKRGLRADHEQANGHADIKSKLFSSSAP